MPQDIKALVKFSFANLFSEPNADNSYLNVLKTVITLAIEIFLPKSTISSGPTNLEI